jgi:leader peptidase (prepilin peptidase) / N-methyltransferase
MIVFSVARAAIAAPFGLVFGSFLTVVVHRVPRGESLVRPRSRCPSCGTPIRPIDNVPVVSWLLLRGRCRACGARISPVYPLVELATGILFAGVAFRYADPWVIALLAPFCGLLLAISVIDIRTKKIPNRLVYPALLSSAGLLVVASLWGADVDLVRSAGGFLALGGGFLLIALIVPKGMGMGDVKLAALIGLVLGSQGLALVGVAAGAGILIGGVGAVTAMVAGASRKQAIPFGPFLAAGALVAVFLGTEIASRYLDLLR